MFQNFGEQVYVRFHQLHDAKTLSGGRRSCLSFSPRLHRQNVCPSDTDRAENEKDDVTGKIIVFVEGVSKHWSLETLA